MKSLTLLLVALAVLVAVAAAAFDQDGKCRHIAKGVGISDETINKVAEFKLYGPAKSTCDERCKSIKMDIGFDYYGKQACCCGKFS